MGRLLIYASKRDLGYAEIFLSALNEKGYQAFLGKESPKEEDFVFLLLSKETERDELLSSCPWLKEQYGLSSYRGFRMMPVLFYRSSYGLEKTWDEGVGEIYEELISGEFKPFGFDMDDPNPLEEFGRIYEEYSE